MIWTPPFFSMLFIMLFRRVPFLSFYSRGTAKVNSR